MIFGILARGVGGGVGGGGGGRVPVSWGRIVSGTLVSGILGRRMFSGILGERMVSGIPGEG